MNRCPLFLFIILSLSFSPSASLSVSFSGWFLFHIKTFHNQPSYWLISIVIIANEFKCPSGIPFCCANYCWINRVLLGHYWQIIIPNCSTLIFHECRRVECWGCPLFVLIYNGHWGIEELRNEEMTNETNKWCIYASADDFRKLKWQFAYFPFRL